ncbi:hypothetical protein G7046_g3112 [Stylonectria norvegica]|nr:hypothetical protein G7046_g3112 [Stylonectria norvegica]
MAARQSLLARPRAPRDVLDDAIENNSVPQLKEALALAELRPIRNCPYEKFLLSALSSSVEEGRIDLVRYLLEEAYAPSIHVSPLTLWAKFSLPLLELLLSHGYDINKSAEPGARTRCQRLIDLACGDEELVKWLIDHGARVDGGEFEYEVFPQPAPLLETCSARGSVSTFKLLQSRGAQLSRRTLHRAAEAAAAIGADPNVESGDYTSQSGSAGNDQLARRIKAKQQRAEMLRFLVNGLKLDVNATDTDIPHHAFHWGTPLCYAATKPDAANVISWLLEKGADPTLKNSEGADAERVAMDNNCDKVVAVLQDWKAAKGISSS